MLLLLWVIEPLVAKILIVVPFVFNVNPVPLKV